MCDFAFRRFSCATLLSTTLLLMGVACSRAVVVHPLSNREVREQFTLEQVRALGRDGDWLVIRGYHGTDNFVSWVTNAPFSHAAVLDLELNQVIEAEASGVHTTPLPDFIKKAQRLMLVRPMWSDEETSKRAVIKARSLVGKGYDLPGFVGINIKDRYYCSELAIAVYEPRVRKSDHVPPVIPPFQLHYWGTVIWDSGAVREP
jgi:Permuted papain-like amidase enzyme, YaeF/YiiX, C92 family